MEKTPNYQLSQWAKTDRILMEDFNADNAHLEAALTALAAAQAAETARVNTALAAKATTTALNSAKSTLQTEDARLDSVKLEMVTILDKTYTLSASKTLSIPASGFGNYAAVVIDIPSFSRSATISAGGGSGDYYSYLSGGQATGSVAAVDTFARILLFPMKNAASRVSLLTYSASPSAGVSTKTYSTLSTLTLTFDMNVTASIPVKITGIK